MNWRIAIRMKTKSMKQVIKFKYLKIRDFRGNGCSSGVTIEWRFRLKVSRNAIIPRMVNASPKPFFIKLKEENLFRIWCKSRKSNSYMGKVMYYKNESTKNIFTYCMAFLLITIDKVLVSTPMTLNCSITNTELLIQFSNKNFAIL